MNPLPPGAMLGILGGGQLGRMSAMAAARLGDGAIDLSLRLLVLTGWAPSPTQQKPARPGSANARLADALGAQEFGTGEQADKPR